MRGYSPASLDIAAQVYYQRTLWLAGANVYILMFVACLILSLNGPRYLPTLLTACIRFLR
jgi:hypothetical protein